MKILHTADIHLGTELYGHYDPRTGTSSRLQDFTAALDRAVDYAIDERVDLFLFAGDAYKTRDPNPTQQREFAMRLQRLLAAGIPVFLLTGNHDMPNALGRATSLDIFGTLRLPNLYVAARPDVYRVETPAGPLQVVAVPWLTRSTLMTKDELKNKSVDEMNDELIERLGQFMEGAVTNLDPALPAVLTLHGSVAGATFGGERTTMLGVDPLVPKSLVSHPAFSYVALGHIHKHQQVVSEPPVVYSGGLERIDFGEERDAKGFVVVEIEPATKKGRWRFVESAARPFKSIHVEAHGDDPTADVLAAVEGRDLQGAIVKLEAHLLDANQSGFSETRVRVALRGVSYLSIVRVVDRGARQRGEGFSTAYSPLQNLGTYLQRQGVPEERAATLMDLACGLVGEGEGRVKREEAFSSSPTNSPTNNYADAVAAGRYDGREVDG